MGLGWFCKQLRAEKTMLDLVPRRLMGVAEQLLGAGTLVEPDESPAPDDAPKKSDNGVGIGQHVRGVINVMPELPDAPRVAAAGRCHTDGHPFSLGVVAYLSDVLPGGGSFSVWPRRTCDIRSVPTLACSQAACLRSGEMWAVTPPTEAARSAGGSARSSSIAWARIRHRRQRDGQESGRGSSKDCSCSPRLAC